MFFLFIIIAAIVLAAIFFAHYFLLHTLVLSFSLANPTLLNILKITFVILSFNFIIASVLIANFSNALVRIIYYLSALWLGWLFYAFSACLLVYLISFFAKIFHFNVNLKILTLALLLLASAITVYGLISANNIKIKKLDIALPNLPASWQGKTMVFLSDLHLGAINRDKFADHVAGLVQELQPDILLVGGDFFDGQKNLDLARLAKIFSSLNVPLGKFFVTGNHEEFGDRSQYIKALADSGITFLDNKMVDINGLQIIGVDYQTAYKKKGVAEILNNLKIDKNQPSILLRHVPDKIEVAAERGVSLMLCGHAHKGQLFPVEYFVAWLYHGYQYGLKKFGSTTVYTSSGAGSWGPPMRILADPEIVQINFKEA